MLLQKLSKLIALGTAAMLSLAAYADSLVPVPPKAKENADPTTLCVEPVADMRKNHMEYILHQRDDTLRTGIRTSKHSLKACISCHNAPSEKDGKVASIDDADHFCSTCHTFAAVKIDCFECHADKPQNTQYRHSLLNEKIPHHASTPAQPLDKATLETLAAQEQAQ